MCLWQEKEQWEVDDEWGILVFSHGPSTLEGAGMPRQQKWQ
jgi:hypothetical protein